MLAWLHGKNCTFALELTFSILLRLGILSLHSQTQFIKYPQRKKELNQEFLEIWIKKFQKTHIGNIIAKRAIKEEISLKKSAAYACT